MAGSYTPKGTNQDSSITWIRTKISCVSVPSKVSQEELWWISSCCITLQFQLDGKSTCTTSELHSQRTPSCKQDSSQVERKPKKDGKLFFAALNSMGSDPDEKYNDLSKPRKVQYKNKLKVTQDAIYWANLCFAQNKGLQFWQTRSLAIILGDSVPGDCIEKVASTRQNKILCQKIPTPRPAPKNCIHRSLGSTAR